MNENMRSPEELAELNKSRLLSDAEAVKNGAEIDAEGKILFTEKQKMSAKEQMEHDAWLKEEAINDSEAETHGIEWLKECSKDNGASLEELQRAINDLYAAGLEGLLPHSSNYKRSFFDMTKYSVGSGYDMAALKEKAYEIKRRFEKAWDNFSKNWDSEKMNKEHPQVIKRNGVLHPALGKSIGIDRVAPEYFGEYYDQAGDIFERYKSFAEAFIQTPEQLAQDVADEKKAKQQKLEREIKQKRRELEELK